MPVASPKASPMAIAVQAPIASPKPSSVATPVTGGGGIVAVPGPGPITANYGVSNYGLASYGIATVSPPIAVPVG